MSIKQNLQDILYTSIKDKYNITLEAINIEVPKKNENGDYATNIALQLCKVTKQNPLVIAKKIANNIDNELIEHIDIVKPGFINIFINKQFLLNNIDEIIDQGEFYGQSNLGQGEKINIEFVSVNPTGLLHVGHARGATYGDNLVRIYNFLGYNATSEYYINDAGNQMNNLGISIKERYKELCGLPYYLNDDCYKGKEIIEVAKTIYSNYNNSKLNEDVEYFKAVGLATLLKQIKTDLDEYRVNFNIWTSEQSLYDKGLVDEVINTLKRKQETFIQDNALWLRTTKYFDEKDRVIIKSDGNYTYLLPDIAYHVDKINRGYNHLIDVLGADHHGYINRLKSSLKILDHDPDMLEIKIVQMVRLIRNNEEIKLSKRTGKTYTLKELIKEVGVDATRYFFSSKSLDTQMDFDLDLAIKQTNENPLYYIEYANARITSILNKVGSSSHIINYKYLSDKSELSILKKLYDFQDIIISAKNNESPHIITNYVYELASLFHAYYQSHHIITDNNDETNEKIKLLMAIKIVLNNALNLLGIIPRDKM